METAIIAIMRQELSLILTFVLIFLADLFLPAGKRKWLGPIACVLLGIHLLANIIPTEGVLFGGMFHNTPLASVMKSILTFGTLMIFMQTRSWLNQEGTEHKKGEFFILSTSTLLGIYFMLSAGHFLMFFLGLELATIPVACLVAFDKYKNNSAEAGAKFILSALFSSGLFLYGVSMLYGTTGTLYFEDMVKEIDGNPLQILSLVFIFSGLAFKLSLVPFHLWTADAYQGAPTPVSAFLSVVSKGAAAFALMSILINVFPGMAETWSEMLCIVIVVTITIANLFAIRQSNLKRFMAFSSISQAGYIMLAVVSGSVTGFASLSYYILVYMASNIAVFGIINAIEHNMVKTRSAAAVLADASVKAEDTQAGASVLTAPDSYETHAEQEETAVCIKDFNGLYKTNPKLSVIMTLALFSLAGIPPFAGFFSKFFVFASAFEQGYYVTVFIALINTVISLYYYLLIVKAIFITPNETPVPYFKSDSGMRATLVICLVGILVLGLTSGVYEYLFSLAA